MQSMKESAANMAASAKAGMEKTKATVQEKVDKMTAHDPMEKEMATEIKEQRIEEANQHKREAMEQNAAAKQSHAAGVGQQNHPVGHTADSFSHSVTGEHGRLTAAHQMSTLPGHGTGAPTGQVTEGAAGLHPIGVNTGTGHNTARNTRVGGAGGATGYGTGGAYS